MKNTTENRINLILTEQAKRQYEKDIQAVNKTNLEAEIFLLKTNKKILRNKLIMLFEKDEEYVNIAIEIKDLELKIEALENKL